MEKSYSQTVFLSYHSIRFISWSLGPLAAIGNIFVIVSLIRSGRRGQGFLCRRNRKCHMVNIRNSPALLVLLHLAIADLGSSLYFCVMSIADLLSICHGYSIFYYDNDTDLSNLEHYSIIINNSTANQTAILKDTWMLSHLCSTARFFSQIGIGCANIFAFFITLRRYLTLFHPMRCQQLNMKRTKLFIGLAWSISLFFTLAITFGSVVLQKSANVSITQFNIVLNLCQPVTIDYVLYLSAIEVMMNTFLSLGSITLYIAISYKMWTKLQRTITDLLYRTQQRIHIMLACIVLTNAVIFLPLTCFMIGAMATPPDLNDLDDISLYWPIAALLSYSNCLIDPLLFISLSFAHLYQRSFRSRRIIRP